MRLDDTELSPTTTEPSIPTALSFVDHMGCVLTSSGAVKCFDKDSVEAISGLDSGVVQVESGEIYACALLSSGGVKCWGNNDHCQLGNGSTGSSSTPTDVVGLTSGVTKISVAKAHQFQHACAVLENGQVKCWGFNSNGELGNGGGANSCSPVTVSGIDNAIDVVGGNNHSCALTSAGAVKCWGSEILLGIGSTSGSPQAKLPQTVTGLSSGVSQIAGGGFHSCAVMNSGDVKCWGYNNAGQVGNGTVSSLATTPQNVSGLNASVKKLALNPYETSCALLTDGTVKCWGSDNYLFDPAIGPNAGAPNTIAVTTATTVGLLTESVVDLSVGGANFCALFAEGVVKCWGYDYGSLAKVEGLGN